MKKNHNHNTTIQIKKHQIVFTDKVILMTFREN